MKQLLPLLGLLLLTGCTQNRCLDDGLNSPGAPPCVILTSSTTLDQDTPSGDSSNLSDEEGSASGSHGSHTGDCGCPTDDETSTETSGPGDSGTTEESSSESSEDTTSSSTESGEETTASGEESTEETETETSSESVGGDGDSDGDEGDSDSDGDDSGDSDDGDCECGEVEHGGWCLVHTHQCKWRCADDMICLPWCIDVEDPRHAKWGTCEYKS